MHALSSFPLKPRKKQKPKHFAYRTKMLLSESFSYIVQYKEMDR